MKLSLFNIHTKSHDGMILIRNTRTGGVVCLSNRAYEIFARGDFTLVTSSLLLQLLNTGIVVEDSVNEFALWNEQLMQTRNKRAELFTLHFIPTIRCQLKCGYCFENGIERGKSMKNKVFDEGLSWISVYLNHFSELKRFKLTFFGGEPLLHKELVLRASKAYREVVVNQGLDFWVELITNGELLDIDFADKLSQHNWARVQITLDGERDMHNRRRPSKNGRDVFTLTTANVRNLLRSHIISYVDIRLSFDNENADSVIRLLDQIADYDNPARIRLILGFITDTYEGLSGTKFDSSLTEKAHLFWMKAKSLGFEIPVDYIAGPLCVATAKHSAVFTPDGGIQKCFATVGRKEFDFASVETKPVKYTKDIRFEQWKRIDQCIEEKCSLLPICGGGCPNDAMIAAGGTHGSINRFCQKSFLLEMNQGLLQIKYG